jgi:hypothetical protein
MQTRYRAAATALLLMATAGLAATGETAEATGTHATGTKAARTLTITIKTKANGVHLSDTRFRPGNTMFKVENAGGKGLIQVLRLRKGYTLKQANADFGAFNGPTPDVKAIRRVDRNVVFYGGTRTPGKPSRPAKLWAVRLDKADKYYAVNFNTNAMTPFRVKGNKQRRALPAQDGWINMDTAPGGVANEFKFGKHNAASGWMSSTNHAKEPHFVVLQHVKKSTTNKDVRDFFNNPAGNPGFQAKDGRGTDTGVISPGHRFLWSYHLPSGKYLTMCFWPSKLDGTPHAFMGMWKLGNLG